MNYARLAPRRRRRHRRRRDLTGSSSTATCSAREFARYPGVYRPADTQGPFMPYLFVGIFISPCLPRRSSTRRGTRAASGRERRCCDSASLLGILLVGYDFVLVGYAITEHRPPYRGDDVLRRRSSNG